MTVNATDCVFDPDSRKYRMGERDGWMEEKRDVEFRHSTRYASRIRREMENGVT